jgi:2'-5' RNA ligase
VVNATRTAIIVQVADVEALVAPYREVLDHTAAWGVPAHITVLYPFVAPDRLTDDVLDAVCGCVSTMPAFTVTFARVAWFREDVLWLVPEPAAPFRALTESARRRFPDHPPYGGAYPDVIPHLTVGSTPLAEHAALQRAAVDLQAELPVTARIDRVSVIAGTDAPGSWHTVAEFALPVA